MTRPAGLTSATLLRAALSALCILLATSGLDGRAARAQRRARRGARTRPAAAPRPKPAAVEPVWEPLRAGEMSVSLPGKPIKWTQPVGTSAGTFDMHLIGVESGGESFLVCYTEFPSSIAHALSQTDVQLLLDIGRDGGLRNVDGELIEEHELKLNGHPGREILASVPSQKAVFRARIYWAKPVLYQVIYVRPRSKKPSEAGQKFLDSLSIARSAEPAH